MKILLDTHAFIWWESEPTQFSPESLAVLLQPDTGTQAGLQLFYSSRY